MSIEVIYAVVKEGYHVLKRVEPFQIRPSPKKKERLVRSYVAACSELVYTTKYSFIRVSSVVKQS